jgi:hypothetical protein
MIVYCHPCKANLTLADSRCPKCGSHNVMIGVLTPDGKPMAAVSRDWARMIVQGRRATGSDETNYSVTAAKSAITNHAGRRARIAPHVRVYNDVKWSYDRHHLERREMYIDSEQDYYRQTWYSLETGEITWGPKEGKLTDPDMHGKSARRGPATTQAES